MYVLHDISQVAARLDLSQNKTRIRRQEILDIRQVAAFNFATFGSGLHMCVCCCKRVDYVCAYVCEKEVYGGESMSDQYGSFLFCF